MKEYIINHFSYDPTTGIITRDDRKNSRGSFDKYGYWIIKIKGKQFKAHRVAWLLFYGQWPKCELDHINRCRGDNRICNLREVTRYQNMQNSKQPVNRKTGVIGVMLDEKTKDLKKKYAVRECGETFRFYSLKDAIQFRKDHGRPIH